MSKNLFAKLLAILLTVVLVVPSAFLIAPQRAIAQYPVGIIYDISVPSVTTSVKTTISAIENTLDAIANAASEIANYAQYINTYVLQPLAFIMSGNLMKSLTAGVISFVIGKTNGNGAAQFTVNLQRSMQLVGDARALAFFAQFGTNSNSPFAASIRSSLTANYLQNTSLAGFWGANMNTLPGTLQSQQAFLNGNWSQGGVASWFALTTQTQNNPYLFYQASQAQLASLVANATAARLSEINWGQGFMSWCGTSDATTQTNNTAVNNAQLSVTAAPIPDASGTFYDSSGNTYLTQTDANAANSATSNAVTANNRAAGINTSSNGINPGDPCTNKDGTAGTIQTPGSTIKATLDKVLGGTQDKLAAMGNIGSQLGSIMGSIGTVLNTVNFASQILGGSGGGLFTVGAGSASNPQSRLAQFAPFQNPSGITSTGYLSSTNSATNVYQSAATFGGSGPDMAKRLSDYKLALSTISTATNNASASLTDLANFCTAAVATEQLKDSPNATFISAATAQATAANDAITAEITPVLNRTDTAGPIIDAAAAMVVKVQCELNAQPNTTVYCDASNPTVATDVTTAYPADLQALQNMPPSAENVVNAQQQSQSFGLAQANPAGSLSVSASPSVVDQMNLISGNAQGLKSVCVPPAGTGSGNNNPGGGGNS